jgi:hypothetical protein
MSIGIVAKRAANALIEDVQTGLQDVPILGAAVDRASTRYGGLWVGGRATLTAASVEFHPNAVNKGLQTGSLDVDVPLSTIMSIEVLPAPLTKIVAIRTSRSVVKIRCFRARAFADQIREAARQAGGLGEFAANAHG